VGSMFFSFYGTLVHAASGGVAANIQVFDIG
jgi:hypothetical protein